MHCVDAAYYTVHAISTALTLLQVVHAIVSKYLVLTPDELAEWEEDPEQVLPCAHPREALNTPYNARY